MDYEELYELYGNEKRRRIRAEEIAQIKEIAETERCYADPERCRAETERYLAEAKRLVQRPKDFVQRD